MPRLTKAKQQAATVKRLETLAIRRAAGQPVAVARKGALDEELRAGVAAIHKLRIIRLLLEV